jgi:flagellar basal body-associated protein FliL
MIEQARNIAGSVVESLREHPLVLMLAVVNVMFLLAMMGLIYSVSKTSAQANERRDSLLTQMAKTNESWENLLSDIARACVLPREDRK